MSSRLIPFRRAFAARTFQRSLRRTYATENDNPQREAQLDREKMDTQANEYAKSGTDSTTAGQDSAAFDPNSSNDPEESAKEAGKGNDVSPLDASPANPGLSSGTSEVSGGADKKKSEGGGGRSDGGDTSGNKSGGSST